MMKIPSTSSDWSHTGDSQESDRSDSMKGSRQKLLEAERERRNQERLAKKLAKEREKLELKRAKEDLKKQAKLVKVKEKAEKQAKKAAQKASSKAERIKHVTAVVDKLIANEESVGLEIMATLNELEIKVEVVSSNVPWSVTWQRAIFKQELLHDYSEVLVPTRFVEENEVVVLWPASEFVNMVEASCHQQMSSVYHSQSTAKECVKQLVTSMSPKRCTIVIYGLEKYYRRMKTKVNREYRSAVLEATNDVATSQPKKKTKKSAEGSTVTHVNVEEVLAELSVYVPCQIHKYESGHEIGQYLARMTKAVADAPYDRRKNQTALSAILCDVGKGTVKVFEDGSGFGTLWKQQLMQFPSVSAQVAHAIASVYTSVRSLREAYKNCGSIREAQNLLQDIMVQRGVGILASNRRVGPELSRKIHAVFTSQHPDTKLQHSVEECQEK
ncbi:crossover junction endonuclease EME1-like isoform X2 [Corticium candelabrum]|uniref:crossover junction endonuclease EME1-like isoform X2 n=1 Tax=Corticium candelabrum TaxID=121492 RepID=UPI002E35A940|nr:crossover junction endonuclease EME1-like isoform X2 [Corticium candelabrum]